MDKITEKKLDDAIMVEMRKLRDNSVATGMKAALGAVLGIIRDKRIKSSVQKLKRIEQFCVKAIGNERKRTTDDEEGSD